MSDEEEDYLRNIPGGIRGTIVIGSQDIFPAKTGGRVSPAFRNLAGRAKSKKEIERENLEALKEGMGTSLFEREKLGDQAKR